MFQIPKVSNSRLSARDMFASFEAPGDGILATQRDSKALVELQVPFELTRQAVNDVERGATDSDWSPLKEAARQIAFGEDRAVFDGYAAAGIQGIREGSSNPGVVFPTNVSGYPGRSPRWQSVDCDSRESMGRMRSCSAPTRTTAGERRK